MPRRAPPWCPYPTPYHHIASTTPPRQTVFLRDVFANEEKVVLTPEDCASPYPICDKSLEMYPSAPICQLSSFKVPRPLCVSCMSCDTGRTACTLSPNDLCAHIVAHTTSTDVRG